jgi:hypothetical protein
MTATKPHALLCHASCRGDAVRSIKVELAIEGGALRLRYVLEGDLTHIRVPQRREPRTTDGLWQHTCFEAFVRSADGRYHEFNFSPSGEWAAYAFSAYRERAPVVPRIDPCIEVSTDTRALTLAAQVPLAALPEDGDKPWRLALSEVIEDAGGALSYWALHHPSDRPDFHHADGFVLQLAAE